MGSGSEAGLEWSIPLASDLIPQHHNCFSLLHLKAKNLPMLHMGPPPHFNCPFVLEGKRKKKPKIITRNPMSSKVQKNFQESDH